MRTLLIILLFTLSLFVNAHTIVYEQADKQHVETLLGDALKQPSSTNWMMWFGKQFFGKPYVGGTLDKGNEEQLIVNLRELDCTTYIETLVALTKCAKNKQTSFDDYCEWLRRIRYIDGIVAYDKRKHYFNIWMQNNEKQKLTKTIESSASPFTASRCPVVNFMSTHVSNYKMLSSHPEWLPGIKNLEGTISGKSFHYITTALLKPTTANNKRLRKYIKDGDIIVVITSKKGLDTQHIMMAHWKSNALHAIHASSTKKKVVDDTVTLYDYCRNIKSILGIRVCRVL